jgi:hypothetical protein
MGVLRMRFFRCAFVVREDAERNSFSRELALNFIYVSARTDPLATIKKVRTIHPS